MFTKSFLLGVLLVLWCSAYAQPETQFEMIKGTPAILCVHGGIDSRTGAETSTEGMSKTDYILASGKKGAVFVVNDTTLYGIARYYDANKKYIGYDETVSDMSKIKYVRFIYLSNGIDNVTIYYDGKTYYSISKQYKVNNLANERDTSLEQIVLNNGINLYLYDNEIWNSSGIVRQFYGWSRTPLIEISNIFDVDRNGIVIDGRAYGNTEAHIPSAIFFDENKNVIEDICEYKVLTSGMGDYIPANLLKKEKAKYVAFNTYNQYYRYLSIKGLGVAGIHRVIKESTDEIKEIRLSESLSGSFFHKLFTKNNPDKEQTVDDYISDKNKVSAEAKALYYKLLELKNEGYFIWGQQDDFTLVLKSGGQILSNGINSPFYCKKVKGKWIPKDLNEININEYCNTYDRCNKLPSATGVDFSIYITPYLRGQKDIAAFGKATLKGLIRKYYNETHGIIQATMHPINPYGGGYDEIDKNFPDAFSQILSKSPDDKGKAKQHFESIVYCIKDILSELLDENGKPIPIIFRPFHERLQINGDHGFWWNYSTDEEYKEVYRELVNRIRDDYTNVLFVYNPNLGIYTTTINKHDFLRAYPGDDIIDLIGIDIYENRIKAVGGLNNLVPLLCSIDDIATSLGKVHIIPEIGNKMGELKDFFNILPRFIDSIGIVPIVMTWNNQSTNYWFTPYDSRTDYFQDYIRFLERNRIYLPK